MNVAKKKTPRRKKCERGTRLVAIRFLKSKWTMEAAVRWALDHGHDAARPGKGSKRFHLVDVGVAEFLGPSKRYPIRSKYFGNKTRGVIGLLACKAVNPSRAAAPAERNPRFSSLPLFGDVVAIVYRRRSNGELYEHPFDSKAVARYDPARRMAMIHPVDAATVKPV